MKFELLNINGEKVKDINLDKEFFGIEPNEKVMQDAIILARASLRQGTAKAKTRAEVSGGGRKPWKQKGTGNARQGSIRAVQWVGGGIAFGPVPRSYNKKQNRKERRLAIKSAYAYRAQNDGLIVVDSLKLANGKTKEMIKVLEALKIADKKVLLIVKDYDDNAILASRNMKNVSLAKYDEVGVLDLIAANKVVVEQEALDLIKGDK